MSLTKEGLAKQRWGHLLSIYQILNQSKNLAWPLNDYGVSNYSDDVIQNLENALRNIRNLLEIYRAIEGNKTTLTDPDLFLIDPKIAEQLTKLVEEIKIYKHDMSENLPKLEVRLEKLITELEPIGFYRFGSIDVSNLGPFDNSQTLIFHDPFTLIVGPNGSGKTTIVKKLESNFPEYQIHPSGRYNISFLIFFTMESVRFFWTNHREFLKIYGIKKEEFDIQVEAFLEEFHSNHKCYHRLIDKNYPSATGEVILMSLVMNFAIRKILHLDYPIVVEEIAPVLDTDYLKLFISFLRNNCSQSIFLALSDSEIEQIGLNSYYYLQLDNETNKSRILITD